MTDTQDKTTVLSLTSLKWTGVIEEFITNGNNPVEAYQTVYKDCKTAPQAANQLFKNIKFVKMLNIRIAEIKAGTERRIGELDAMYQKAYNLAIQQKQPAAAGTNTTGIARLYGMDKDAGVKDATIIIISPPKQLNSRKTVESEVIENE